MIKNRPSQAAWRTVTAALVVAGLAGCAHPDYLRVGMTRAELDARFGEPSAERRDGDDDVRIYTSQPLGQRASAAHVAPDGRVTAVEPVLNTEHFAMIRVGTANKRDIVEHFGQPAYMTRTRSYEVWTYRYREGEVWNSLFNIMFDAEGTVRQTQNEQDPMFDPSAIKRG